MMTRDFVDDVNNNLQTFMTSLADHIPDGEVGQFGPLTVGSVGVQHPVYNRIFAFDPQPATNWQQQWRGWKSVTSRFG